MFEWDYQSCNTDLGEKRVCIFLGLIEGRIWEGGTGPFTRFWGKSVLQKSFGKVLIALLLFGSLAFAEPVKISMKVGEKKQLTVTDVGDDPKVMNPSPDIFVSRDFNDPKNVSLWIIPSGKGNLYLGIASNSGGKTKLYELQVEVGDGTKPPDKPTDPVNPPPDTAKQYLMVVRPDGPKSPGLETILGMQAWKDLNVPYGDNPISALPAAVQQKLQGTQLPVVTYWVYEGDKIKFVDKTPVPVPTTSDGIKGLLK